MVLKISGSPERSNTISLIKIVSLIMIFTFFTVVMMSCSKPEFTTSTDNTWLIIWDAEKNLANYKPLTDSLQERFPHTVILSEYLPDTAVTFLESELYSVPENALCIFILITNRLNFHISSEWNLWFPDIWRNMNSKGKVLVVDASWGDEFLNPIKTPNENNIWAIDGKLGYLRRKLPDSLLASSCRFDESNLISRGIDGKTKTPLYSWYFINELCSDSDGSRKLEIISSLKKTAELTQTARERGIVSDLEEVLYFNRSQVNRDEFTTYPNPVIWNGLAKKVYIEVKE